MRLSRNQPAFDPSRASTPAFGGSAPRLDQATPARSVGASASVNSPAASSASNFANAVLAEAGSVSGRIPSVEELALRLEARQQLRGLDRPLQRPQLTDGIQTSPEGLRDATPDHPLYGRYLGEWMETNRPDAGRALIGLFRSTLGELRAAISKSSSSGDSARRTAGPS